MDPKIARNLILIIGILSFSGPAVLVWAIHLFEEDLEYLPYIVTAGSLFGILMTVIFVRTVKKNETVKCRPDTAPGPSEFKETEETERFETNMSYMFAGMYPGVLFFLIGAIILLSGYDTVDPVIYLVAACAVLFGISALSFSVCLLETKSKMIIEGSSITYITFYGKIQKFTFKDVIKVSLDGSTVILHIASKFISLVPKNGRPVLPMVYARGIEIISMYSVEKQSKRICIDYGIRIYYGTHITADDRYVHLHMKDKKGRDGTVKHKKNSILSDYLLLLAKDMGIEIRSLV